MPRVARRRWIDADPEAIWAVISDPHHLPRWWPRTSRVESVSGGEPKGRRWTQVLQTRGGRGVRADYRCISAASGERYIFEQELAETPFEKILRSSRTEIGLEPDRGGTRVTLTSVQRLRGLSRFGSPMMRRATGRTLSAALDGLEAAVAGGPGGPQR